MSEFRSLRKSLGLTLDKTAEQLGVSRRTVCRWSSGKQAPKPAMRLLRLLNQGKLMEPESKPR